MKPLDSQEDWHLALLAKDGLTVLCGKCTSEIGRMSRLVIDEETSDDKKRTLARPEAYDPVQAHRRAQILEASGINPQRGKPYFIFKEGYIQKKNGSFVLGNQADVRSAEGSRLLARQEGMAKRAEKIFPESRSVFQGSVIYRLYEVEGDQEAAFEREQVADDMVIFSIYGKGNALNRIYAEVTENWRQEHEAEISAKRQADQLRESVRFLAELRQNNHFLQLPPLAGDAEPVLLRCWKCNEEVSVIPKGLATQFEKWEAETLAKALNL